MAKVGRNDPCPCGSGTKHKKCCWQKSQDERVTRLALTATRDLGGPAPELPADLARQVQDMLYVLDERGIRTTDPDEEWAAQTEFATACRARWANVAQPDARTETAARALRETTEGVTIIRVAQTNLDSWVSLGDTAIPHLAQALHSDAEESCVAVEILSQLPAGPNRDRALIEALFAAGDWLPDTAVRQVDTLDPSTSWPLFVEVATFAGNSGIELQSLYWDRLFQIDTPDGTLLPGPRYGEAIRLMYDHGHFAALAWGLKSALDPMMAGVESVRAHVEDAGFRDGIEYVRAHEGTRPARRTTDAALTT